MSVVDEVHAEARRGIDEAGLGGARSGGDQ
jgi:hypothetical protein